MLSCCDLCDAMPVLTWASLNMAGKPTGTKRARLARCMSGADCQHHLSLCDGAMQSTMLLSNP